MATYYVDAERQALRGTGIVEPVFEWDVDRETQKRKPSDRQARSEEGVPQWAVEVQYVSESYGRQSTVISRAVVAAPTQPAVEPFEVIQFTGLRVQVRVDKRTNQTTETWEADSIGSAAAAGRRSQGEAA